MYYCMNYQKTVWDFTHFFWFRWWQIEGMLMKSRLKLGYRLRKNETMSIFPHLKTRGKYKRASPEGEGLGERKRKAIRRMHWSNLAGCPERAMNFLLTSDPPRLLRDQARPPVKGLPWKRLRNSKFVLLCLAFMALCFFLFPGLLIDDSSLSLVQPCLPCGSFVQTDYPTNSWTVLLFLCYFYQLLVKRAAADKLEKSGFSFPIFETSYPYTLSWKLSSTQVRLSVNTFFSTRFTAGQHFEGGKKNDFHIPLFIPLIHTS